MTSAGTAPARSKWLWPRAWLLLLAVCLSAIGVVDAILLERTTSYFSSGFNSVYIDSLALAAAYLAGSLLFDSFLVLALWAAVQPMARLLRTSPLQTFGLAAVAAVVTPLAANFVRHNLHTVLGRRVSLSLLRDAFDPAEMAAHALGQLPVDGLLVAAGIGLAAVAALLVARPLEARWRDPERTLAYPRRRTLVLGCLATGVLGALVLAAPSQPAARLQHGLGRKPSARLLTSVVERVTDFDRDGYGLLSTPPDPAPFDGSVHPYALDVPGNDVDEDGLAGDHPAGFEPVPLVREETFRGRGRPHFLLLFLESFRTDLLGRRFEGREITPFLNRLAREGVSSRNAFVHTPYTVYSRAQLFGGRLVPYPGQTTLIDDFRERGYRIGHFSGQDDTFGNSEALLGVERADVYYHARDDIARRTSDSTTPASLQISWKLLEERVVEFLSEHDPDQPLFLYVNVVDTHFPYHHAEVDDILGVTPIERGDIRADRAEQVWRTYANTAANVDLALERIVAAWRARIGDRDQAILVTADHGQSFYEAGYLGHGFLDRDQVSVPLILWGIGGDWPEPIGLADVRGLLRRNLAADRDRAPPRARFVPDSAREIVQYTSGVERPHQIALRSLERTTRYDFRSRRGAILGPDDGRLEVPDAVLEQSLGRLIRNWEALHWEQAARTADPGGREGALPSADPGG